jgi:nucleoside-diphosphate-sugar epimerase
MNILVTGLTGKTGAGFINAACKDKELIDNYFFKVFVRSTSSLSNLEKSSLHYSIFPGEITNEANLSSFMSDRHYDVLLHIAGIGYSKLIVQEAIKHNISRMIVVHTTGVYSKYKSAAEGYQLIDKEVRELCDKQSISLSIIRPTMIFGSLSDKNLSVFIKMVDKLKFFPLVNGGKSLLQPVSSNDLGNALYLILKNPEKTRNKDYVISGEQPIALRDMLKEIGKQLNKKTHFFTIPFFIAYFLAFSLFLLSFGKKDYREKVQRLVEDRAYPHDAAAKDFNYSPGSFSNEIKNEISAYITKKYQ